MPFLCDLKRMEHMQDLADADAEEPIWCTMCRQFVGCCRARTQETLAVVKPKAKAFSSSCVATPHDASHLALFAGPTCWLAGSTCTVTSATCVTQGGFAMVPSTFKAPGPPEAVVSACLVHTATPWQSCQVRRSLRVFSWPASSQKTGSCFLRDADGPVPRREAAAVLLSSLRSLRQPWQLRTR